MSNNRRPEREWRFYLSDMIDFAQDDVPDLLKMREQIQIHAQ